MLPESTDPAHRARNLSELTADDKASFTFEWKMYEQDYREYKEQETNCEKLKAWVTDTVDYGLRQSSCRAVWDLPTWYANLRTSVGATEREQQAAARRMYQSATTFLTKVPKDFAGWITTWEMATNHALVRRTGGVEDPNIWFEDLTKAVQPILGNWSTIYAGIYKDKLEDKTLTIGEVAKDLRKEAERRNFLHSGDKASKTVRGVFGPTLAGDPDSRSPKGHDTEATVTSTSSPPLQEGNHKRKSRDAQQSRRKRAATLSEAGELCKACDGGHQLAKCYYAFPKLAPNNFKERKLVRDAFEHRIKTDSSLRDDIKHINKLNLTESDD
jgi:hypothetical protein